MWLVFIHWWRQEKKWLWKGNDRREKKHRSGKKEWRTFREKQRGKLERDQMAQLLGIQYLVLKV